MRATRVCLTVGMFFAGSVSFAQAAEMALIPVSANGPHTILGNEITLASGGQRVVIDLVISGWAPKEIVAYQVTIDSSGYTSGSAGSLASASVGCSTAADCVPDFGRCSLRGATCTQTSDCEFASFGELCISGTTCDIVGNTLTAPLVCVPAFITSSRADYVLDGAPNLPALDVSTPNFRIAGVVTAGSVPDPGGLRYAGTLVLDVSLDAAGTFTVGLISGASNGLVDPNSASITPLVLSPVLITIAAGCTSNANCDDGDPCTTDLCDLSQNCVHSPNFDQKIACCNPVDGSLCDLPSGLPGDTDGDFDVDLLDAALFQTCFGATSIPLACAGTDLDCDCGSGASDHALFVPAITGPSGP